MRARDRFDHRKSTALGAAVAVIAMALLLVGQAASTTTTAAYYAASITNPSPAKVATGATVKVTVKLTNCDAASCPGKASATTLGSVDVTSAGPHAQWIADRHGNGRQQLVGQPLRKHRQSADTREVLQLPDRRQVDLRDRQLTAPAAVDPSKNPYTVVTKAKRDGDFDDGTLTRVGSDPQLTVYLPLDHFEVTAPATATAGTALAFTVAAKDAANNTITGYTGTVHFTSTDPKIP